MTDLIEFVRHRGYIHRSRRIFLELCIWFSDEPCNGPFNIGGSSQVLCCCALGVLTREHWPDFASNVKKCKQFQVKWKRWLMRAQRNFEGGTRTGSILKAGLHLGLDCGLWAICPVYMETTYQLENQAPGRKSPSLKEYPDYLCNRIESYILLCLLGYDHRPSDNCPLDDTTLMAESEEELIKPLDESGEWKSWLKAQHSGNEDHGNRSHHFMGNRWGNSGNCQTLFFGGPKSLQMVTAAMKLKDTYSLEGKLWPT